MRRMTTKELRERYAEVFGEQARTGNRDWLVKRIAWRIQANAEGDLSERARQRAVELADDSDLRLSPPKPAKPQPEVSTILRRLYKGRMIEVTVRDGAYEYEGQRYRSLSAIAKAVTGSHWNGRRFFNVQNGGAQ